MEKLPVIREGSSAKTTSFCHARLDGPGGLHLFFDGNGKVTAENGTLADPRPNAFSLPASSFGDAAHCPDSTPTCRAACYVDGLAKAQPDLYATYEHNARTIRAIFDDLDWMDESCNSLADAWCLHVADWIKKNAAGGFRWHVSGDVFSFEYAEWIADVVRESAPVRHWIYTRSFDFLVPLMEVSTLRGGNLAINLSVDKDNFAAGATASLEHADRDGNVPRLNYLVTSADEKIPPLGKDDVIFPDYPLRLSAKTFEESAWWQSLDARDRGLVCPVDARGKAETRRCGLGANQCGRCLK